MFCTNKILLVISKKKFSMNDFRTQVHLRFKEFKKSFAVRNFQEMIFTKLVDHAHSIIRNGSSPSEVSFMLLLFARSPQGCEISCLLLSMNRAPQREGCSTLNHQYIKYCQQQCVGT